MATDLEKREKKAVNNTAAEQINESGTAYSPDVDIYSSENDVMFTVDLPGVEKGDVQIEVTENDTLVIRARNSFSEPENPILRQYRTGDYYRAFQISNDFDKEKISGTLENGLLRITIPKREEARPKRIEIKA
ncbi:MAG: Hsp20 family protein [Chitinivibrionales bacterium]|nr:Hsp20 family protein [Chitinivibrionales bacterium]